MTYNVGTKFTYRYVDGVMFQTQIADGLINHDEPDPEHEVEVGTHFICVKFFDELSQRMSIKLVPA